MKKLHRYTNKSPIMDIRIKYGNELFKFNLYEELVIDENKLNKELKEQPSYYGFMGLLLVKLQRSKDDAEAEVNKKEAMLFVKYKSELDPNTNRPYSNDLTQSLVMDDDEYQKALKIFNGFKESVGIISMCLKSFEQRSSLLQSLSANRRNEKF